ncbi:MAG: response regulator [Chitinophagaceae bacterium]|nr:MAG: LytTR family two component transcriptional regulator [Bacteroidetes bacterium OLB11]MCC6447938.1 response regulator [Chitinophagaceae bacterium]HMN32899.1 response regulator [Chitinophagaceae bacterium]
MLKAIIIDDEENARITLAALLAEYAPDIHIMAQCSTVPEGVLAINKHNPDVVFLDVEMPEYNGFELLGFFKKINFEIIFVTAYSQYAIRAFEVSAVDYLLKPIEIDSLKVSIDKVKNKCNTTNTMQRLNLMREVYSGNDFQKIALQMSNGLLFVEVNNIVLFEAERAYTNVFMADGSKFTVSKPMRTFEDLLSDRQFIFRPHRSYLINVRYIKKYLRGESLITMDNNFTVSVARERKSDFESLLKELKLA